MAYQQVHSVLGVGFGPANLSLAVALEELGCSGARFIERASGFQWQDEQLLPGTDIQNNPFRDLAMPRNPDSPHTFVKYLAARQDLTGYLHLNAKFPLRREYAGYLGWVAGGFRSYVDYGQSAVRLSLIEYGDDEVIRVETASGRCYLGRSLVIGTGRSPRVPAEFIRHIGPTVFHATNYLSSIAKLSDRGIRVAVVGASQSAIEVVLDLLGRANVEQVLSIQRGIGFRLKDTSPYSRQVFLPEFVDYFHPLPRQVKSRLREQLRSINYAACDQDVIDRLTGVQREYELTGCDRLRLMSFSEVTEVTPHADGHRLRIRDVNYQTQSSMDVDVVVLATGFRDFGTGAEDELYHPLLAGVLERLERDESGVPVVARDYSIPVRRMAYGPPPPRIYLNGLCEASHGMGDAGALAMLSVRATDICESLTRQEEEPGHNGRVALKAAL
ncbi:L-ornithine N5-oxygenase [Kibdelosporangium banguiense]|uniref:L-lysine N6-monooxygenase MbtG n=1 Tax=Kibdelosporangium banguiense TaxID=1365924 RepID=A0ABS4TS57_9PSEU|nr:SidA/IucD/PvdA family monooxygenase [Kibdelosporangium banguiense]MBP2327237.1 L-ornithine N5-oxygenase [Kibdelosporangium banguiense]